MPSDYLVRAQEIARDTDPTLPISVDINGRPDHPEQFTYHKFDMLGINQYFGWYRWVENFDDLPLPPGDARPVPGPRAGDDRVRRRGAAGARQRRRSALKGSYAFQTFHSQPHARRGRRRAVLSGAIYWTCASSRSIPAGAAAPGAPEARPNTRHQKGLITYEGVKKPAWYAARDRFMPTPLYP